MNLLHDLRQTLRSLSKSPGYAALAVLVLSLGLGANTAIFSVIHAVLLDPLPYDAPEELVVIRENRLPDLPAFSVAPGNYVYWRERNESFEYMAAASRNISVLLGNDGPAEISVDRVTHDLFQLLAVEPALGRWFTAEEDQEGADTVAILSHKMWQQRFGGDPEILGRTIILGGEQKTVIGVMPDWLRFRGQPELWIPMAFSSAEQQNHGGHYIVAYGRLKSNVGLEQAGAEMRSLAAKLEEEFPNSNEGWSAYLVPMLEEQVGDSKAMLLVLFGAVGLVLLISCANVANLQLVRAMSRAREFAIRTALGAKKRVLVWQLMTESLILSIVAGAVGVFFASYGIDVLVSSASIPRGEEISIDLPVLGFSFVLALLSGIAFSLLPALQAAGTDPAPLVKDGGRGVTAGKGRRRAQGILVVGEVALALTLLIGVGLLIQSLARLQEVDLGFDSESILTVAVNVPFGYPSVAEGRHQLFNQLLPKVLALPGVTTAATTSTLPLQSVRYLSIQVPWATPEAQAANRSAQYSAISPGALETMGILLMQGRGFTEQDQEGRPKVALINEELAQRMSPNESPIGKFIGIDSDQLSEIVGVVANLKLERPTESPAIQVYEPYDQSAAGSAYLAVKTSVPAATLAEAIRLAVLEVDPSQPIGRVQTLQGVVEESILFERFSTRLLGAFAVTALLLACLGIYGVIAYSARIRRQELGIRRALGAQKTDILELVIGQAFRVVLLGSAIGLLGALAASRMIGSLLFETSALDPTTFVAASLILMTVGILAALIPALQSTRVDPATTLRQD